MYLEQRENIVAAILDDTLEGSQLLEQATRANSSSVGLQHTHEAVTENGGGGSNTSWWGARTLEQARELMANGWSEGAARIAELECEAPHVESTRRRRVRAEQGDELEVQALLRGDLSRAWTRTRRQSRPGLRVIRLLVNVGGPSRTTASELFWRGAAALRAVEALEGAGYSVELWAGSGAEKCSSSIDRAAVFCCIKSSDTPLDLSRLAGLVALPAWFRTEVFAARGVMIEQCGGTVRGSMGSTHEGALLEGAALVGLTPHGVIPRTVDSRESAQAWLREQLPAVLLPEAAAA